MTKTRIALASIATAALLLAASCSQQYSAERDGKKLGEAVCDLKNADSPEDAQRALDDVNEQIDDLGNKYSLYTAEDRNDVQNNLADLHEHVIQGNTALVQQDLAVLQRSIKNIASDSNDTTRAAWEGVNEGLADCTD